MAVGTIVTAAVPKESSKFFRQWITHASVLSRAADAAKQAGVPCDTMQVENARPYQAIIAAASDRGCDLIVMASHGCGGLASRARQCDKQGPNAHENPRFGVSLNARAGRFGSADTAPNRMSRTHNSRPASV